MSLLCRAVLPPETPSLILHTLNLPSSTLCCLITRTSSPSISSQPHVPEGQQLCLCPGTELDVQVVELSLLCSEHRGGAASARCPHYACHLWDLELSTRRRPATPASWLAPHPGTASHTGVSGLWTQPVGIPTIRFKKAHEVEVVNQKVL